MDNKVFYHLSKKLDTPYPILTDVIKNKKLHYRQVFIKKKNGKIRKVYSPSSSLRYYQNWIASEILEKALVHESCTSYQKKIGLKMNVIPHQNNKYFLTIDIEDFFTNILSNKVLNFFKDLVHDIKLAEILTELCTLNNSLPQGALTSPAISNAINYQLDVRISGYAKKNGLTYTRYADDITLSSNNLQEIKKAMYAVKFIIKNEGYKINKNKIKLMKPGTRRKVTGLLINEKQEIRVGRKKYRELRSMIYTYKNNKAITGKERELLLRKITGWISYLKVVDVKTFIILNVYISKLYEPYYRNPFEQSLNVTPKFYLHSFIDQ